MKTKITFLAMMAMAICMPAQQLCLSTLNQSGGFGQSGGMAMSWSLGDMFVSTLTGSGQGLTEGFQQDYYCADSVLLAIEIPIAQLGNECISVVGNPFTSWIDLQSHCGELLDLDYSLLDLNGRVVLAGRLEILDQKVRIEIPGLAQGIYLLSLSNLNQMYQQHFKLLKTL